MDRADIKRLIREKIKQNKSLITNNKLLLKHIESMHSLEKKAERIAKLSLLVSSTSVVIATAAWFIPFEVNKHQNSVKNSQTLLVHLGNLRHKATESLFSGCGVINQTKEELLKKLPGLASTFDPMSDYKDLSIIQAMSFSVNDNLLISELNNFFIIYSLNVRRSNLMKLSDWYVPDKVDYSIPEYPKVIEYGTDVPLEVLAEFYSTNILFNIYISYLMQAIQLSIQDNVLSDEYELYLQNSTSEMLDLRLRLYNQFKLNYKADALSALKCRKAFKMGNGLVYTYLKNKG